MRANILIVQTGTAAPELVRDHGDYPAWFQQVLGEKYTVIRAHEGEKLPSGTPQGIIVTGSPLSVTDKAPWMAELGDEVIRASQRGAQVLGVCFGHQLIAKAAGGEVILNPRGREIGTVQVQLTEAGRRDPLFAWARDGQSADARSIGGGEVDVQATHVDAVDPLPPGATLLASNENCAAQAYRLSPTLAGVQFHPEVPPEALRDLILSRADKIRSEGRDPKALAAQVRETQSGRLLEAFVRLAAHS
jgi:GMP synthase (glutamine-hydrolysing)